MIIQNQLKWLIPGSIKVLVPLFLVVSSLCHSQTAGRLRLCEQIPSVYWESFPQKRKDAVLNSERIPKDILDYYDDLWSPSDDDRSFNMLDSLTAPLSNDTRALYLFLFSKICKNSDGAIAEVLGEYCQKMVLSNPDYALTYLFFNQELLHCFAAYLSEFYFGDSLKDPGCEDFLELKQSLDTSHISDQRAIVTKKELLRLIISPQ